MPLLRWLAHNAQQMESSQGCARIVYKSTLDIEVSLETRDHRSGRRPQVDFVIAGTTEDRQPVYFVPVEAKPKIAMKDLSQLAHLYAAHCGASQYTRGKVTLGLLIDEDKAVMSFNAWSCKEDGLLLPISLFSPPFSWRNGITLDRGGCITLCLALKISFDRIPSLIGTL